MYPVLSLFKQICHVEFQPFCIIGAHKRSEAQEWHPGTTWRHALIGSMELAVYFQCNNQAWKYSWSVRSKTDFYFFFLLYTRTLELFWGRWEPGSSSCEYKKREAWGDQGKWTSVQLQDHIQNQWGKAAQGDGKRNQKWEGKTRSKMWVCVLLALIIDSCITWEAPDRIMLHVYLAQNICELFHNIQYRGNAEGCFG